MCEPIHGQVRRSPLRWTLRILAPTRTVFVALAGGFSLACACAFLLFSLNPVPVSAASPEQKQDSARNRIEQTSRAIEEGSAGIEAAQARATAAAGREAGLSELIADGKQRSAELAGRLDRAESALERSRTRLERARRLLAERLVAIYVSGEQPGTLDLALGAADFGELATGSAYLTAIRESDARLADRVAELRHNLSGQVAELHDARRAVDEHVSALNDAYVRISAARAAAESTAASLAAANAGREGQIDSLKRDIAGWQKQIRQQQQVTAEEAEIEVEQNLGGPYSIPTYIVMCESGGDYSALNPSSGAGGAYQIIPSTWEAYGGTGLPQEASKAEQDRIAALIWADVGASAWSCA